MRSSYDDAMQKTQTICLLILTTIAVGMSLAYLKTVLLPFVIAVFIVIGCRPILQFLESRLKFPKIIAFAATFLTGLLLVASFAVLVWISINDLSRNIGAYEKRLDHIASWLVERLPESGEKKLSERAATPLASGEKNLGAGDSELESLKARDQFETDDLNSATENTSEALHEFLDYASHYVETQLLKLAGSLSTMLSSGVLILIFVFFLLLGHKQIDEQLLIANVSQSDEVQSQQALGSIVDEIEEKVRMYLVMKTVISMLTGFAFGLVLWLFGVPLAVVFGVLAFLLNFIPNIGPLISTMLPVPFLVLNSSMSPTMAILCFLLCSAIQFISGNIVETRTMGKSFDVHPAFLLLALMFFGLIWGIVGMFLATPIVSIVKIVLSQHKMGQPVAELMAGRFGHPDVRKG